MKMKARHVKDSFYSYVGDLDVEVTFEFWPGYTGSWDEPPEDTEIDILDVVATVGDEVVSVADDLSEDCLERMEREAYIYLAQQAQQVEEDWAADRAAERAERY